MSSVLMGSTPSDLSMKNTVPSGGFASDGFFDCTGLQTEVPHQVRYGIPGLVAFIDGRNRNAGSGDHRSAERNCRVHDYEARVGRRGCIRLGVSGEGVE